MRGWLSCLAKERNSQRQVAPYRELATLFEFYAQFTIVPFDERAASQFDVLRSAKIRIGTMDLKIAAIALDGGKGTRLFELELRTEKSEGRISRLQPTPHLPPASAGGAVESRDCSAKCGPEKMTALNAIG